MLWQSRHLPRERARRRADHGLDRPGAREGHHDHGQEHGHPLQGRQDQHRGHPRPRRLRRRGRADADAGRRRAAAGRRRGGPAAPDPLRAARRRSRPGSRRSWSSTRSTARTPAPAEVLDEVYDLFIDLDADRGAARVPGALHRRAQGHRHARRSTERGQTLEPLFETLLATVPAPRFDPATGLQLRAAIARLGRLRRPAHHRPHRQRPGPAGRPRRRGPSRRQRRARQGHRALRLRGAQARGGGRGRPRASIVAIAGIEAMEIGETRRRPREAGGAAASSTSTSPPCRMLFSSNVSPFAGQARASSSPPRQLRERL